MAWVVSSSALKPARKMVIMETLLYDIGNGKYRDIYIGNGILDGLPAVAAKLKADKFLIVTDSQMDNSIKEKVRGLLASVTETHIFSFPAGEGSKNLSTLESVASQILDKFATKSSVIVCLGGGVVGNLGGLLAALLFRGIRFFHIPTTMVAQIDSAIGQKQAVNYKKGKNLFGQYYPPEFVFVDFDFLRSLPQRHIKAGLAESVKHALCQDEKFFNYLEKNAGSYNWAMIDEISRRTIIMKLELLVIDPFEGKLDPQLELGHTIGHAIEIIKSGKLLHGEAVSIGMVAEAKVSCALGFMNNGLCEKIAGILTKIGLPVNIPADVTIDQIIETLKYDNKRKTVKNDFFLLEDFTCFHKENGKIGTKVPEDTLRHILENCY